MGFSYLEHGTSLTSVRGCNFYTGDLCNKKLVSSFGVNRAPTSVSCFWKIGKKNKRIDIIDGNQVNTESQSREFKARQTTTHFDGCFLTCFLPFCTLLGALAGWPLWIPSAGSLHLQLPVQFSQWETSRRSQGWHSYSQAPPKWAMG